MSNIFLKNPVDSFIINVYTIGYKSKGESIYISFESENKEFFYDVLIDCYKTDVNISKEILDIVKINKKIDCICLTHYHDDHFLGLNEIIDEYSKKGTKVLVPDVDCESSLSEEAVSMRNEIAEIVKYGRTKKGTVKKISEPQNIVNDSILTNDKKIEFGILAISPISKITMRNVGRKPEQIEQNDYSISLLIYLDDLRFLFTGDIMNNTINELNENYKVNYLKIPHHCSKDSNKLLKKIDTNEHTVCVATNYQASGLPNVEMLNNYKDITDELYITKNGSNDDFGIIHTKYILNISQNSLVYDTKQLYNSSKYSKELVWKY